MSSSRRQTCTPKRGCEGTHFARLGRRSSGPHSTRSDTTVPSEAARAHTSHARPAKLWPAQHPHTQNETVTKRGCEGTHFARQAGEALALTAPSTQNRAKQRHHWFLTCQKIHNPCKVASKQQPSVCSPSLKSRAAQGQVSAVFSIACRSDAVTSQYSAALAVLAM